MGAHERSLQLAQALSQGDPGRLPLEESPDGQTLPLVQHLQQRCFGLAGGETEGVAVHVDGVRGEVEVLPEVRELVLRVQCERALLAVHRGAAAYSIVSSRTISRTSRRGSSVSAYIRPGNG